MAERQPKVSPLKRRLLRSPGQSCTEEMENLFDNRILPWVVVLSMIPGMLAAGGLQCLFRVALTWREMTFLTILGGVVCLICFRRLLSLRTIYRAYRLGHLGERFVAEELDKLREQGYRTFNDLAGERFNIDHVLVGPTGVYSVETKTRRQRAEGSPRLTFDGERVLVDGLLPDRDPISQARGNAQHVQRMLSHLVGGKLWVQPIVFFPGWDIDYRCNKTESAAWVVNERTLKCALWGEPPRLSDEDVQRICAALDELCREKEGT